MHSVVFSTIFEKYIHTKIEANLLKSVAYITPDIHVPLFNRFGPKLNFSRFIISMTPFGVNGTERVKVDPHSIGVLGPELMPDSRQSACH